jgi:hypothetical protein
LKQNKTEDKTMPDEDNQNKLPETPDTSSGNFNNILPLGGEVTLKFIINESDSGPAPEPEPTPEPKEKSSK